MEINVRVRGSIVEYSQVQGTTYANERRNHVHKKEPGT